MKKIYYLLVLLSVAFTACQKQPELAPETYTKAMVLTLPSTTMFTSTDDAGAKIPAILTTNYPQLGNGSSASVTFSIAAAVLPPAPILPDSVISFTKVAYTLTTADYKLLPGNTYTDFNATQILTWLPIKYPLITSGKTANNKTDRLALLTFTYYENGVTSTATQSFLYTLSTNTWAKIYTISPAQYTSIGKGGTYNDFSSSDDANLLSYFNTLLKADLQVNSIVKTGDVQNVSYKYFASTNYQRVMPLIFDGTNWTNKVLPTGTGTLSFAKTNGAWILDAAVNYTLIQDDYTSIGTQTTAGTVAGRASVAKYPDFNTSATTDTDYWSDDDINAALIAVLNSKFKSTANKDQIFNVTWANYQFGKTTNAVKVFTYNGSAFVVYTPPAAK